MVVKAATMQICSVCHIDLVLKVRLHHLEGSVGACEGREGSSPSRIQVPLPLQGEGKQAAQQQGVTAAEVTAALGPPLPQIACNDAELADARWFSRAWLAAVLSGELPRRPMGNICFHLIAHSLMA
jgi:hypothetical protein